MSPSDKIARMTQPTALKNDAFQPWSGGRGTEVWATICAAIRGDLRAIQDLVAGDPRLATCSYAYLSPIRFAVRENHRAVIDYLLERGADPAYEAGDSLITIARDRGYQELTAWLEGEVARRYRMIPDGHLVPAAIRARDPARVHELLHRRPELINAGDERGNQPIHWAVMTRQIELIDHLVGLGADINASRPDGARPLDLTNGDYHYRGWRDVPETALQRHDVLIGYLIARGADYDISVAAKVGDLDRVRLLLDREPGLANRVPAYSTYYSGVPLRCAAGAGHLEVVKLLLAREADPNVPEPGIAPQGGALHAAIGGDHLAVAKLLLEHGADPNASVESSGNCLYMAKHVRASDAMVDLVASYGGTLTVELICYEGDVEQLAALLRQNPKLPIDEHALHAAISNGHRACLELILRFQPSILETFALTRSKSADLARWLMQQGLDPNRGNWLGVTPLHQAAADGNVDLATACLEFGADINAIDTDSCSTPLGWAAREGRRSMVDWLLAKGASPRLPADEPWAQPAAWASRRGHPELVEALS